MYDGISFWPKQCLTMVLASYFLGICFARWTKCPFNYSDLQEVYLPVYKFHYLGYIHTLIYPHSDLHLTLCHQDSDSFQYNPHMYSYIHLVGRHRFQDKESNRGHRSFPLDIWLLKRVKIILLNLKHIQGKYYTMTKVLHWTWTNNDISYFDLLVRFGNISSLVSFEQEAILHIIFFLSFIVFEHLISFTKL